jgi:hypothetical protein
MDSATLSLSGYMRLKKLGTSDPFDMIGEVLLFLCIEE